MMDGPVFKKKKNAISFLRKGSLGVGSEDRTTECVPFFLVGKTIKLHFFFFFLIIVSKSKIQAMTRLIPWSHRCPNTVRSDIGVPDATSSFTWPELTVAPPSVLAIVLCCCRCSDQYTTTSGSFSTPPPLPAGKCSP